MFLGRKKNWEVGSKEIGLWWREKKLEPRVGKGRNFELRIF